MSSVGAASAAQLSRGSRIEMPQDYAVILPPLPNGYVVQNTVFLHADVKGRPYHAEDFREPLFRRVPPTEVLALGAYQMNHVWAVTCKSAEGVKKLLAEPQLTVKGLKCMVIDPSHRDVRLKLHWLLYHVREEDVRNALIPYGTVVDVGMDKWRIDGYTQQNTMTRTVTLRLKANVTLDDIPHQLRVGGELALIVAPGRAPRCLRCQQIGHIRKDCRVPRCDTCKRFGHAQANCTRTYAAATLNTGGTDKSELTMDEAEAEESVKSKADSAGKTPSTAGMTQLKKEAAKSTESARVVQPIAESPVKSKVTSAGETPCTGGMTEVNEMARSADSAGVQSAAESSTSAKESHVSKDVTAETSESKRTTQTVQEPSDGCAMEWHDAEEPGTGGKRPRDAVPSEPNDASSQEPPAKAAVFRRQRLMVKPNVVEGEKRPAKPPP
ncbi:uncharacterized protein LOC119381835 [Rhipicephalus sanguineus]|nr:uncharacterized protein LOC119381835 [Rhipicephalus sanguineus]